MLKHVVKTQARAQLHGERGATAVEYGLMVALISVAIVGVVSILGGALSAVFTQIAMDTSSLNHPLP